MQSGEFFKRFTDDQEFGRDVTETELHVFYDNGREVGLWRENRRTTEGAGETLSSADAEMARYWYVQGGRQKAEAARRDWFERTAAARFGERER